MEEQVPTVDGGGQQMTQRLIEVVLDPDSIQRASKDVERERKIAIFDLVEENFFSPIGAPEGPYRLDLAMIKRRLVLIVRTEDGQELTTHILSLTPFKKIVRDYFMICESYYEAIRSASPSQIEAIDMGRRGVHNEGAGILKERLDGKIDVDHQTSRRLFTLLCSLHPKG
ncbi:MULTISPECIES: UPF0262 family protein [Pseudovibrio]|uniref:UPF0262 family protein n=1 Tax=Stappiaceae TaxID=2821832 RepID=UPI0023662725|nr:MULTISPECIES: UPF0262 family protein [Pseudovibrio]MDD7911086.1 UPF0262 family protein [Pseudovibrio exalbescens]MDX5595699.1 UPF0262 family protein [Pseudovibrio sp. SPO723]